MWFLLYVSDHGESLGEAGLYLHGAPYMLAPAEQTKVPMMVWMSEGYADANRIEAACLATQARTGSFSHDNLFSTVLGAMHVSTGLYRAGTDVFAACRGSVMQAALEQVPDVVQN